MQIQPSAFYRNESGRVQADKSPEARLEFGLDWVDVLNGAKITKATWTCDQSEIVLESPRIGDSVAYCWVKGGELDSVHEIVCTVELDDGRIDSASFLCAIKRREPSI